MGRKRKYSGRWLLLLLASLMVLLLLVLAVGNTRAHFEQITQLPLALQYRDAAARIHILSAEKNEAGKYVTDADGNLMVPTGWQVAEQDPDAVPPSAGEETVSDTMYLRFLLANGPGSTYASQTQNVVLTLFATEGVADPEALQITLHDSGNRYAAVVTEIKPGSAWYETYGPGWTYRFYNGAGEELTWLLQGGRFSAQEMSLTLTGAGEEVALLTLIASIAPEEN